MVVSCAAIRPHPLQNGEVQVFDAVNLKAVAVIPAHDSPLAALAFNYNGTKLASASTTVSNYVGSVLWEWKGRGRSGNSKVLLWSIGLGLGYKPWVVLGRMWQIIICHAL